MRFGRKASGGDRLAALARKIEAAVQQDQERVRQAEQFAQLRSRAAVELYAVCSEFVNSVNQRLNQPLVELSPAEYSRDSYRDNGANVIQINVSGRIVHLEFHATETLTSAERFATPYILEGSVRAFNQQLLEMSVVPEQLLFCCPQGNRLIWLSFDPRTQRSAPLDQERLMMLLDRLM
jgi:hypothetical protein